VSSARCARAESLQLHGLAWNPKILSTDHKIIKATLG
jgi:hypothetical protein